MTHEDEPEQGATPEEAKGSTRSDRDRRKLQNRQLRHFLGKIARVGLAQFKEGRKHTIDTLLHYFETGELPNNIQTDVIEEMPRFVRPRLIQVGDALLTPRTVQRSRNPVLPLVREAFITFEAVDDVGQDIPPLRVVTDDRDVPSHLNVAFSFTTALSLRENLTDFYRFVTSRPSSEAPSSGTADLQQFMRGNPFPKK